MQKRPSGRFFAFGRVLIAAGTPAFWVNLLGGHVWLSPEYYGETVLLQLLRRALLSVGVSAAFGAVLRAASPDQQPDLTFGGWRELRLDELPED